MLMIVWDLGVNLSVALFQKWKLCFFPYCVHHGNHLLSCVFISSHSSILDLIYLDPNL